MLKGIFLGFFLLIAGMGLYYYQYQSSTSSALPVNSMILAFDYDGQHGSVTAPQLIAGDAFIFLKILPDNKNYFLSTFKELQGLGNEKKEYIALDNPDFNYLYVGRYVKKSSTIQYQLLQKSGIAGIIFEYANGIIKSAVIVLSDNSRRSVSIVPINDNFLFKAKLLSTPLFP